MAYHIEDDAAAILAAIIPRRTLRLLPVALEHPVAELTAYRQHPPEEAGVAQEGELLQARQEQLVLHRAMLHTLGVGELDHVNGLLEPGRDRLLAIDVLAGADRLGQQSGPRLRGRGIEEDRVGLVGQRLVEIGGPARHAELLGQTFDLARIASDQNRIGHHAVAVRQQNAAGVADRDDRADQMLIEPHPPGDAVHDDAETLRAHIACSCAILVVGTSSGFSAVQSGWTPEANPAVTSDPVRRSPS